MSNSVDTRPLGALFETLSNDVFTLLRQKTALARAEMTANALGVALRIAGVLTGAIIIAGGLLAIAASVVLMAIEFGLRPWLAALLVGVLAVTGGALMAQRFFAGLRVGSLIPTETVNSLREDFAWLRAETNK